MSWEKKWEILDESNIHGGITGKVAKVKNIISGEIGLLKRPYSGTGATKAARGAQIKKESEILYALGGKIYKNSGEFDIFIPKCLDVSKDNRFENQYYIAEFAEGVSLHNYIMSDNISRYIFLIAIYALLQVIEYVHSNGYLWLDVKLEHVIINIKNKKIYCIDWGNSEKFDPNKGKKDSRSNRNSDYKQWLELIKKNISYAYPPLEKDLDLPINLSDNFEESIEKSQLKDRLYRLIIDEENEIKNLRKQEEIALDNLKTNELSEIEKKLKLYNLESSINYEKLERIIVAKFQKAIRERNLVDFDVNEVTSIFKKDTIDQEVATELLFIWKDFYELSKKYKISEDKIIRLIKLLNDKNYIDFYYNFYYSCYDIENKTINNDLNCMYLNLIKIVGKDKNFNPEKIREDIIHNFEEMRYGAAEELSKELLIQNNEPSFSNNFYKDIRNFIENIQDSFNGEYKDVFDNINKFSTIINDYVTRNNVKRNANKKWLEEFNSIFKDLKKGKSPNYNFVNAYNFIWLDTYFIDNYTQKDKRRIEKFFDSYQKEKNNYDNFDIDTYQHIFEVIKYFNAIYNIALEFRDFDGYQKLKEKIYALKSNEIYKTLLNKKIINEEYLNEFIEYSEFRKGVYLSTSTGRKYFDEVDLIQKRRIFKWKLLNDLVEKYEQNKKIFNKWNLNIQDSIKSFEEKKIEIIKLFKINGKSIDETIKNEINKSINEYNNTYSKISFISNDVDIDFKKRFVINTNFRQIDFEGSLEWCIENNNLAKSIENEIKDLNEKFEKINKDNDTNNKIANQISKLNNLNNNYLKSIKENKFNKILNIHWDDYSSRISQIEMRFEVSKDFENDLLKLKDKISQTEKLIKIRINQKELKNEVKKLEDEIEEFNKKHKKHKFFDDLKNIKNQYKKKKKRRYIKFVLLCVGLFIVVFSWLVTQYIPIDNVNCRIHSIDVKEDINRSTVTYECIGLKDVENVFLFENEKQVIPIDVKNVGDKNFYTIEKMCDQNNFYQLSWSQGFMGNSHEFIILQNVFYPCKPSPISNFQIFTEEEGVKFVWDKFSFDEYSGFNKEFENQFFIRVIRTLEDGSDEMQKILSIKDTTFIDNELEYDKNYLYQFSVKDFRGVESEIILKDYQHKKSDHQKCYDLQTWLSVNSNDWGEILRQVDLFSDDQLLQITSNCDVFGNGKTQLSREEFITQFLYYIKESNFDDLSIENKKIINWIIKSSEICALQENHFMLIEDKLILNASFENQKENLLDLGITPMKILKDEFVNIAFDVACFDQDSKENLFSNEFINNPYALENVLDFSSLMDGNSIFKYSTDENNQIWRTKPSTEIENVFYWPIKEIFDDVEYSSIKFRIILASGQNNLLQSTIYSIYWGDTELLKFRFNYSDFIQEIEFLDINTDEILYKSNYEPLNTFKCRYFSNEIYCFYGMIDKNNTIVEYDLIIDNIIEKNKKFGISMQGNSSLTWDFMNIEINAVDKEKSKTEIIIE